MTRLRRVLLLFALAAVLASTVPFTTRAARVTVPPPTATARPAIVPPALPPVYYQDGANLYAMYPDGSGRTYLATLPPHSGELLQPVLLPDGRLLYPAGSGVSAMDTHGRSYGLHIPDLDPGERVWSVALSPDGHTLAWQLFAPVQQNAYSTNVGNSRIVLTGRFGDAGTPVFSAAPSGSLGQVPALLGWRRASPFGSGDATLLLQNVYSNNDATAQVTANTTRGLIEYDPAIDDVVNDYLPPLSSDIPPQRAFALSHDGIWAIYGDALALTPSGDGPLAQELYALDLDTGKTIHLDSEHNYPGLRVKTKHVRRKVGKRTVTQTVTTRLHLYQYFSHRVYIAPDNRHVLYTNLTVSYPPGALVPRVQRYVQLVTLDGRVHQALTKNAQAEGWLNSRTVVVKTGDGLYAVDIVSGTTSQLVKSAGAQFIGAR